MARYKTSQERIININGVNIPQAINSNTHKSRLYAAGYLAGSNRSEELGDLADLHATYDIRPIYNEPVTPEHNIYLWGLAQGQTDLTSPGSRSKRSKGSQPRSWTLTNSSGDPVHVLDLIDLMNRTERNPQFAGIEFWPGTEEDK